MKAGDQHPDRAGMCALYRRGHACPDPAAGEPIAGIPVCAFHREMVTAIAQEAAARAGRSDPRRGRSSTS